MTLLLTPLCAAAIVLSLLILPLGGSWAGQTLLVPALRSVCRGMGGAAAWASDSRMAMLSLRGRTAGLIILAMTAALLLLLCIRLPARRRWVVFAPILCGWLLLLGSAGLTAKLHENEVTVTVRDTSAQSEAIVLTRGQEAVIVDLSDGSLTAMRTAMRQADAQGASEVAALVLTHSHSRMSGTLYRTLRAEKVRALYLPVPQTEQDYYLTVQLLAQAESAGVSCFLYRTGGADAPGDTLTLADGLTVSLFETHIPRSSQPVLLLSLRTQGDSLLWCGGAVMESDLADTAGMLARAAGTVLFGAHGPLYKQAYALPGGCAPSVVCFGSPESAAWFDTASLPDPCPVLLVGGYRGRMYLK